MEISALTYARSGSGWSGSPAWAEGGALFSDRERAGLAWAASVTKVSQTGVKQADYGAAAAVFRERELADLTIAIGLMNAYNRMAISIRAEPEAVRKATLG